MYNDESNSKDCSTIIRRGAIWSIQKKQKKKKNDLFDPLDLEAHIKTW